MLTVRVPSADGTVTEFDVVASTSSPATAWNYIEGLWVYARGYKVTSVHKSPPGCLD